MLTTSILKSNTVLASLTEEQFAAIETLSRNDENSVISANRKEWWDKLDEDVQEVFGEAKPGGEKSHENHKRWLLDMKKKADGAGDVSRIAKERDDLKKELEEVKKTGSLDSTLKKEYAKLEQALKDKEAELTAVKTEYEGKTGQLTEQLKSERNRVVSFQSQKQIADYHLSNKLAYNPNIPEEVRNVVLKTEQDAFMQSVIPDFIDEGGTQRLVFRDKQTNEILRNKENGLHPYTAGELFYQREGVKSLIDKGKSQAGAGTGASSQTTPVTIANLSNAKDQINADKMIVDYLIKTEGLTKLSPNFAERQKELRQEHNVDQLPLREGQASA